MTQNTDFTISDVLAWARTKPAGEKYEYYCNACALGQFLFDTARIANVDEMDWAGAVVSIDGNLGGPLGGALSRLPWTFGGLVERLEALFPETPVTKPDWLAIDAYMTDIERVIA